MAAISTIVAAAALAVGVAGTYVSYEQGQKAKTAARKAGDESKFQRDQEKGIQAQQAAQERRQQIREERVRRARIIQSSENSGTAGASGEVGALGGLATSLGSNLGANNAAVATGQAISASAQRAADYGFASQSAAGAASNARNVAGLAFSTFQSAGGFGSLQKGTARMGGTVDNSIFGTGGAGSQGMAR